MLNTTLLGLCDTFASVLDSILSLFSPVFSLVGFSLPTIASICTSLFGA
jgi:hypothetical protein